MAGTLAEAIKAAGVVGAGGAGFPTHVKATSQADTVIANGSECEPLLFSDQCLMQLHAAEIVAGMELMMAAVGAERGIIGTKAKYSKVVRGFEQVLDGRTDITIVQLANFYPSGDEQSLVYETTGRVVPEGAIPLAVGAVVNNVETLRNIARASKGIPVTDRLVTINGEVRKPGVFRVPIGTPVAAVVEAAGGTPLAEDELAVIDGGPMMGAFRFDLLGVVRKTTSGLIVVPKDHYHVGRSTRSDFMEIRRAVGMCCQCRECTDLCFRHQLGHALEPHSIMRKVMMADEDPQSLAEAYLCCGCGICDIIACPLELSPRKLYIKIRKDLQAKGIPNPHKHAPEAPRDTYELRKLPKDRVLMKTGLWSYHGHRDYLGSLEGVARVEILLSQHIGAPSQPVVAEGDHVVPGDLVAGIPDGKLGANHHASIAGVVTRITGDRIVIEGTRS
jgi:Na+-translocating ferredoxin:NAD+ oxidoreductase RnfC subunit